MNFLRVILAAAFIIPAMAQAREQNQKVVFNVVCDGEVGDAGVEFEFWTDQANKLVLTKASVKAVVFRQPSPFPEQLKVTRGFVAIADAGIQASKSDISYLWDNQYKFQNASEVVNLKASIKTIFMTEDLTVSCRVDAIKNLSLKSEFSVGN